MKTTSGIIFMGIFFLIIGILITTWYFKTQRVCFDLPKHGGTDEWGPKYWKSLHSIVARIPCGMCREEASEMMMFLHDKINLKLEKKLHDEDNFYKWVNKICDINKKP